MSYWSWWCKGKFRIYQKYSLQTWLQEKKKKREISSLERTNYIEYFLVYSYIYMKISFEVVATTLRFYMK